MLNGPKSPLPTIYDGDPSYIRSQLRRELLGVLSLVPFDQHNSASRKQMFASHIGQSLVVSGSTERHIRTGMENEYGKFTFSVKMPVAADVIRVIPRYPPMMGDGAIRHNPETLVIYENVENKEVSYISIPDYFSHHQYFGFRYKHQPIVSKLRSGLSIPKDTILANSPSVTEMGGYKPGVECNVAFMSVPSVSEDGVMASRQALDRFTIRIYETRVVEWGNKKFPLNMYGDENVYKPFPDIGDPLRPDGVLAAFRTFDDWMAPVEQSRKRLTHLDAVYDEKVYAGGPGKVIDGHTVSGRVIDIRVMHDPESVVPSTPIGMESQIDKYDKARHRFYDAILKEYERLRHERGNGLRISKEFSRLVVEAISVIYPTRSLKKSSAAPDSSDRVSKLYKAIPLDDYRVEFVVEYVITPTIGFKVTDTHGGK